MASAAKKPVGIFELITTPAKRDKDRKEFAKYLLEDAEKRILADRAAALDIRPILRALATADAAMIAKIMAVIHPAGSIITVGAERFAYVTGVGYVLMHATRDSIVYTDGVLTMMDIEIASDARITRANTTGMSFRRSDRLIHINLVPYGEYYRISGISVTPMGEIPDSLVKFEVPTEMFYDAATNMTEMNLYGIKEQMYHTYNSDDAVTTKFVKGTMVKIVEHNGSSRKYQQLHEDLILENGIYTLRTKSGSVRFDTANTIHDGIMTIKGHIYKFRWGTSIRKYRMATDGFLIEIV